MTPTAFLVLAIAFYIISDLVIFFRQRDRIAGLKALAADRDGEIAEWKAKWAARDNDAIAAGADLVRRDETIAALGEQVRNLIGAVKERGEIIGRKNLQTASLRADLADEKRRVEALKGENARLSGMNESIEGRLSLKIAELKNLIEVMKEATEKRVHDGYSKGYALGLADAFERVRQVFPIESA